MHEPHFGFTKHGLAVHLRTHDHLKPQPGDGWYARLNKRIALWMVRNVMTMTCFWLIEILCLLALPSVLYSMNVISTKMILTTYGFYLLLTWGISTNFQAIMLPAIGVGQNIQGEAADARAAKTFEDAEVIADRLDTTTKGGITEVLDAVNAQKNEMAMLAASVKAVLAAPAPGGSAGTAGRKP
jgi:hypothetical protein